MKRLFLSQLVGLISATYETRDIKVSSNYSTWEGVFFDYGGIPTKKGVYDVPGRISSISLYWKNKVHTGSKEQELHISFDQVKVGFCYHNKKPYFTPVGSIYLYHGDNCNDHTYFIYYLIGNEVDIIDDLGVVGASDKIGRKSLCNLSAAKHRHNQFNGLDDEF